MIDLATNIHEYFELLIAWMPSYLGTFLNAIFFVFCATAFLKVILSFVHILTGHFLPGA